MRLFKTRASETIEKSETEEEQILRAAVDDEMVNFVEAMKVPTFNSCITLIEDTISMIPFKLYKREGEKVKEIKDDTRIFLLNNETRDTLDGVQFKKAMVRDYFAGKGAYAYINKSGLKIESIHYVESKEISFQYSTDPIFKSYSISVRGTKYEPHDFLKILRNTKDGRAGSGIVEENKQILAVAIAALKYEKSLVATGGNKKGFVKSPKKLTDEAIKKLKVSWMKMYRNNTENVIVLNEGMEFQESSNTSVEMQINENKKENRKEICEILHVPLPMITGTATEQDNVNFILYCIMPILNAATCALDRDLLLETEKGSYFYGVDVSELTKGDIKKRYEAYQIACRAGFMQADEVRFKEKMEPLGLNFIKLGLQDVLYDPTTKEIYIPNMNAKMDMTKNNLKGGDESADTN